MRVKNMLGVACHFSFATPYGGRVLKAGAVSQRLPPSMYYDERLQKALKKGLIEVQFDEEDVGVVGVAGLPGPVAQVLSKLNPKPEIPEGGVVADPKPVLVVKSDAPEKPVEPKRARPVSQPNDIGSMRASFLARDLKVPFHVLAAAVEKQFKTRIYPITVLTKEQVDAMRDKYSEKLEIPEVSKKPSRRKAEVRTLSDLKASSDGILSLADLVDQNKGS